MTDVPVDFIDLFEKNGFAHLAKGRPKVSLSIQDHETPYRYREVRGTVVDLTEAGGDSHIDRLAKKYLGEVRVIYRIQPDRFSTYG